MKKIILIICATTLFVACSKSSSDDAPVVPSTSGVFISRVETTRDDGTTKIERFTYDGNKIVELTLSATQKVRYIYVDGQIDNSQSFFNNINTGTTSYTYTSGKLTNIYRTEIANNGTGNTYTSRNAFVHDTPNNKISFTRYSINSSNVETIIGSGTYTYLNGNLTKETYTCTTFNEVINYTYDTKNNAVRNILGFDKLIENEQFSLNNVLSSSQARNETPSSGSPYATTLNNTYNYIYNSNNYVTSEVRIQTATNPFIQIPSRTQTTNYFY